MDTKPARRKEVREFVDVIVHAASLSSDKRLLRAAAEANGSGVYSRDGGIDNAADCRTSYFACVISYTVKARKAMVTP